MDERLRFVARLLEGEKMAVLCREFDISRKTGYRIFQRYKDCGGVGLTVVRNNHVLTMRRLHDADYAPTGTAAREYS
jgi:hypothetical protein